MTAPAPLFSVIVPTFNRRALLSQCLASIAAQSFRDFEVIVVDDGSTDGTAEDLARLEEPVRWTAAANAGPGAARNRGAALARGRFLTFLDSDDLWFPWTLQVLADALAAEDNPPFVVGVNVQFSAADELAVTASAPELRRFPCFYDAYGEMRLGVPTHATCVAADAFHALGGFPPLYVGEDVDLWLRLGCASPFLWVLAPPLAAQRRHPHRVTHDMGRTVTGIAALIRSERAGRFPGGRRWRAVREHRLAAAARSASVAVARVDLAAAFAIYADAFAMNLRQLRMKYLMAFPLYALRCRLVSPRRP